MKQEIGLLIVFLLVFLYDTFFSKKAQGALPVVTCVLFALLTAFGLLCPSVKDGAVAFAGMYATSPAIVAIKNILNVGVLIVLIQSIKWANSEFTAVRRGEFYELILLTLLGMYFMISSGHFLIFIIGLETASLPLAAMVAFDKNRYESHEAAIKYILTAVFSSAILLMGLSFVYGIAGTLYYDGIAMSLFGGSAMSVMLIVALAFVIAGFGFKLSLVPFHMWTA
ncbi:MAG: NADH-quinone oxidoreductase subunit N, partial [Duncaniella sp.]|nr:NADH-quinone oxidoreductase subunit N [Duncaniella sp.]